MKNAFNFRPWMVLAVLLTYSLGTWAQSITLKGIVKDDFGESIIGASVLQKGTTNGTVTDLDGNFTLTVPNKNAVLVISFIGYLTQEITVGNQTHFNVLLKEDAQNLDEVIVIGYGTAKKSDLTGAVTRADMGALEKSPNVNTRVRDNILKSKEQKNIQPTKGGHKMVTCQNYVSLFYRQITSCPSDGGIS